MSPREQLAISLPAALLILAAGLSSSTACISYGAAAGVAAVGVAASGTVAAAADQLERNRVARVGGTALPTVTADPLSLEAALRPALPAQGPGSRPEGDRLHVVAQPRDPSGGAVFEIAAYGAFTPAYAQAFGDFANRLRLQLPAKTKFIVLVYRDGSGPPRLVSRMEID